MDRLPEADFVPHRTPRQEYLEEGEAIGLEKGLELEKIEVIQGMLAKNFDWQIIEDITHINEAAYQALKSKYKN
jgi:hypothetical protein